MEVGNKSFKVLTVTVNSFIDGNYKVIGYNENGKINHSSNESLVNNTFVMFLH